MPYGGRQYRVRLTAPPDDGNDVTTGERRMLVYPLSRKEECVVVWGGRLLMAGSLLVIALLGAVSLVA
ncbi:MAG: hypothetical protein H6816_04515 [Phycisphaerales bacterium]|nr:hypothetical protein [Phycisphaerales bacterium]